MTAVALCEPCQTDGWWGPTVGRGTHCPECHRTFTAGSHCSTCHRHFSAVSGFELHLRHGCHDLSEQVYACGGPKFELVGIPGQEVVTGTLHAKVCRNWKTCGRV